MGSLKKMDSNSYFTKYLNMVMDPKNRNKNGEEIWTDLEKLHVKKFGVNKFNSYASFKNEKSRYYKYLRRF
jgi:hypothetical protein